MTSRPSLLQRALTHRLLSGAMPGTLLRWTHRHVGAVPTWREMYDELRSAERAASGEELLTESQLDLLEGAVLAQVAEPARVRAASVYGLAAAAAAGAFALVLVLAPARDTANDFVARGSGAPAVGLRVRCLAASDVEAPTVLSASLLGAERAGAPLRCPAEALLAFSVTNLTAGPAHVFLIGVRDDGELLWFSPFERSAGSVSIQQGVTDQVLDVIAATGSMELGRRVTLFAVFDDRPLDPGALERSLRGAQSRGLSLHALDRLPLDVPAQGRAELIVTSAPSP